eukprot:TRINITY_DN10596_c0_g3_i2.p2 TRINITY_DN10596_c0_g3~~TRINITY_DN10596_c0_g3_i2.p2  ORF type:complete len:111 (+),score=14.26 TRINITY_DN10596_c0_g3_i2:1276-1608(+)
MAMEERGFLQKLIQAAAVAFSGHRGVLHSDYPATGVASYRLERRLLWLACGCVAVGDDKEEDVTRTLASRMCSGSGVGMAGLSPSTFGHGPSYPYSMSASTCRVFLHLFE